MEIRAAEPLGEEKRSLWFPQIPSVLGGNGAASSLFPHMALGNLPEQTQKKLVFALCSLFDVVLLQCSVEIVFLEVQLR